MSLGLLLGSKPGSIGTLVKDLPIGRGVEWRLGCGMRVNYETSVKVRRLCLRFMNNMGSGLVVGLGSGSIYRIIHIYAPYLPRGEGQTTIGVGE